MTRQECKELIEDYLNWLRRGLSVERLDEACELTTPFLDRHNDHLQIYARSEDGKIVLSDDGYILADLRQSGVELSTPKREAVLRATLSGFGVRVQGKELVIEASRKNLGQRVHSLVQAMLAVNDMFVMAQPRVATFFWDDVRQFLDEHEVRYSPRVKIAGRSGFDHAIDFLIPKSKAQPERLIQTINMPSKSTVSNVLFVVEDTQEAREAESRAYAFLNDRDRETGGDVMEALEAYAVTPVRWSRRDEYVSPLAG